MRTVELKLSGHLTRDTLEGALREVQPRIQRERLGVLLVDCLTMVDYDLAAREMFVSWLREHRWRFSSVAVVTSNRLWHLVVAAMALASRASVKAFDTRSDAEAWLARER